jgi:2'-5' RNA ligase
MALSFPLRAAFLAIPLSGEALTQFRDLQERLHEHTDCLRFQSPETPHLTLQYWKELMEIEYGQILKQADKISASTTPFDLRIEGIGTFGNRGEDRVLYLDVPFSEELARLKKRCPWPSLDSFHPHITLARVSHPQRFAIVKKKILKILDHPRMIMTVDRIRLYAEIDRKKQTPLLDFPLMKAFSL